LFLFFLISDTSLRFFLQISFEKIEKILAEMEIALLAFLAVAEIRK